MLELLAEHNVVAELFGPRMHAEVLGRAYNVGSNTILMSHCGLVSALFCFRF